MVLSIVLYLRDTSSSSFSFILTALSITLASKLGSHVNFPPIYADMSFCICQDAIGALCLRNAPTGPLYLTPF